MASSGSEGGGDDDDQWSDWAEGDDDGSGAAGTGAGQSVIALFDTTTWPTVAAALAHVKAAHGVDVPDLIRQLRMHFLPCPDTHALSLPGAAHAARCAMPGLDDYGRIRLINYLRSLVRSPSKGACPG
jgi:hypothetical protein